MRKLLSFFLCLVLLLSLPLTAFAEPSPPPFELTVLVEGGNDTTVRAYQDSYRGNLYLSLIDLSQALNGTAGQFRINYNYSAIHGEGFQVLKGEPAGPASSGGLPRLMANTRPSLKQLGLSRNRFLLGESERKYYTFRSSDQDLYMGLNDIQMALDMTIEPLSESSIRIDPTKPFVPDLEPLLAQGYFDVFNGVLLADADTGKALYAQAPNRVVPIASLSKLMSYVLFMEAIEDGRLQTDDLVAVSPAAARLSSSPDGLLYLVAGTEVPAGELLEAMMLASSNECTLALAEYVYGSEENCVAKMNEKAAELGLHSASFFTPHGLPVYLGSPISAKQQNSMSAQDLFRLVRHILQRFPQITDITSQQYGRMPSLDYTTANSNPLVFNLEGVTGLKTGSTNKAGFCLAATLPVTSGGETHNIVLILLGAETADVRAQAAEILLRYARDHYERNGF